MLLKLSQNQDYQPLISIIMKKSTFYAFSFLLYVNFMLAQAPSVDSFLPTTVCVGDTLTITGSHFTTATDVTLGGLSLGSFSIIDDTTINAVIDTGLSGDVVVVNGDGSGSLAGFVMNPNSDAGTASASTSTVCTGTNEVFLTLSGYVGTIQWQSSTDNITFSAITGEVADSYTATNLTETTYYRAIVTSGVCSSSTSNVITVTVSPVSVAGTASTTDTTVCTGTNEASITLSDAVGSIQWQSSTNNIVFSNLSGEVSTTLTVTNLTQTTYYRAVVTSGACSSDTSNVVTVTVTPASVAGTASASAGTLCAGVNDSLLTLAGSTGTIQWQSSSDNVVFTDLVGETFATYSAVDLTATTYYRAVVTSGVCSTDTSNVVTLTVDPVSDAGTASASETTLCAGTNAVTMTLAGAVGTIQWQSSSDNVTFSDVAGEVSATYDAIDLTATTYYRAVVTSGVCSEATSNVVTVTVNSAAEAGTASAPYTEVCFGTNTDTLTLAGAAGDIQWQSSTDNVVFEDVVGETTATYTATDLTATTYFRAVVASGGCSSATSNVVTITVGGESVGGTINQLSYKCSGEGSIELQGYVGEIQWQVSTDNLVFTDLDGEVGATLSFTGLTDTTYYRAVVTNSVCSSAYSDTYTAVIRTTNFVGTEWSNGEPGADAYVTISSDYEPAGDLLACALVVDNDAIVLIPTGSNLVLEGSLTVVPGSQLILSSNSNLVQATDVANSGDVVVRRNSSSIKRLDYTLWSAPVVGQNLAAFSPSTLTTRFYTYNPSTDLYDIANTALDFATGKGYLIRTPNNFPSTPTVWSGSFTGVPTNGPVSVAVTNGGYNAIGNPYPSTLDADAFITENSITEALYFWRKTNAAAGTAYATYTLAGGAGTGNDNGETPSGVIQVGQGFIAKATASTVTFTNSMRLANNANQFFKVAPERSRYWLNLSNAAGMLSQTMVAYMTNATNDYDAAIDGKYFNDSATALTSVFNNQEYAIQGRALPFVSSDVVSLGFKAEAAGTYTIALDHTDGLFAANQSIYLKDNLTNTTYDLGAGSYTFSTSTGVYNGRFEIVYQSTLGVGTPTLTADRLVVYAQNQQLVVNAGTVELDNVKVFDIQGRLLASVSNIKNTEVKIALDATNEIILVKATSTDGATVTKKILK
jgi:hypothetical protein